MPELVPSVAEPLRRAHRAEHRHVDALRHAVCLHGLIEAIDVELGVVRHDFDPRRAHRRAAAAPLEQHGMGATASVDNRCRSMPCTGRRADRLDAPWRAEAERTRSLPAISSTTATRITAHGAMSPPCRS